MPEECRQQLGPAMEPAEFLDQDPAQLGCVLGCEVGQPAVLGVLPHHLVGVGLGGIGGQRLGEDLRVLRQVGPHRLRAVVDVRSIPEDRHRPGQVPPQLLQECHRVLAVGVRVVGQQPEIQPQPSPLRAYGHGADRRDPVVAVPALQDRGLTPRGEGAADRRGEHEARLVEEDQVGLPASGSTDDAGQFLTPSEVDRRLVPLLGPALGLLAGPLQPPLEHLADVLGVEADVEVPLDQFGGPGGRPQFGPPAVGLGALQEQGSQSPQLLGGEPGPGAGMGLGGQLLGCLAGELHPGVDGGASAAEEVGDVLGGLPLLDEFDGTDTATLEFFSGSDGSHTQYTSSTGLLFSWPGWSQYVTFWIILLGQFLVFPNWLLLVYLGVATWLFHRQVLREEAYLIQHYGREYAEYCARVRRYV